MIQSSQGMSLGATTPVRKLLQAGLGLCLYQLVLLLMVTGGRYSELVHWDASWYRDIAILGYQVSFPLPHNSGGGSNIAFFPGFPIWTRWVHQLLGVNGNVAVNLAAEFAAVGLWSYFLLLLARLRVGAWVGAFLVLTLLVQPGAFYFVVGYSESLFVFSLLGMVYWTDRFFNSNRAPSSWLFFVLAVLHGGILSGTRFLGVALAGFPVLLALLQRRRFGAGLALSVLNLWGFLGYIFYCHFKYGHWDLYWEANRVGWQVYFDSSKLFQLSYYLGDFFQGNLSEVVGRILTVGSLIVLIRMIPRFIRRNDSSMTSAQYDALPGAMALLNLGLMIETIVGSHGMHSMVRYLLPIHALLLPLVGVAWQRRVLKKPSLGLAMGTCGVLLLLFAIQILFSIRYSRSDWVS